MSNLLPGSPEWQRLITASKVAAILGVSPWESQRSIWHQMRGEVEREPQTTVQARGHYLEPAILAWWRDQHPEHAEYREQPTYTLDDWGAATPDATALCGTEGGADWSRVLIEAKSARDMDEWGDPGTDVIPAYYLTQVYWQLHLSGAARCYVPVIGPWLEFHEYVVESDAEIGADLERRMREFYDSLQADEPPPLDDSTATFDVIRKMHKDIDKGETAELSPDEAREYIEAMNAYRDADTRARAAKTLAYDRAGRAQYLTCQGVRIARRQANKTGVHLVQVAKTTELIDDETSAA